MTIFFKQYMILITYMQFLRKNDYMLQDHHIFLFYFTTLNKTRLSYN